MIDPKSNKLKVTDFINGPVKYDNEGQYFWIVSERGEFQMLAELRGWGRIQNMKGVKGNLQEAGKFQDEIGEWVARAINEKLERESKPETV